MKNQGKLIEAGGLAVQLHKYEILKAQIELMAAMLVGSHRNRILGEHYDELHPVVIDILRMLHGSKVDPLLLIASCKFAQ